MIRRTEFSGYDYLIALITLSFIVLASGCQNTGTTTPGPEVITYSTESPLTIPPPSSTATLEPPTPSATQVQPTATEIQPTNTKEPNEPAPTVTAYPPLSGSGGGVFALGSTDDWEIYVMNADGTDMRQLTDNSSRDG